MATLVSSQDQDVATSRPSITTLSGQKLVASEHILIRDEFEGGTLDETARWTKTTASGGTVVQATASGCTLDTSTNSAGSALIKSINRLPLFAGSEVALRASLKFGSDGEASNSREMSLYVDSSNYAQFIYEGTTFVTRVYSGGSAFGGDGTINLVQPNDNTFMDLEIRVSRAPDRVHFILNDVQVASYEQRGSATRLFQGMLPYAYFKNLNAGASGSHRMIITSVLATRRFNAIPGVVRAKKMSADGIVVQGPCLYLGCKRLATVGGTATIYDNTSGTGTIVDEITTAMDNTVNAGAIECFNGIYVDVSTDALMVYYIA